MLSKVFTSQRKVFAQCSLLTDFSDSCPLPNDSPARSMEGSFNAGPKTRSLRHVSPGMYQHADAHTYMHAYVHTIHMHFVYYVVHHFMMNCFVLCHVDVPHPHSSTLSVPIRTSASTLHANPAHNHAPHTRNGLFGSSPSSPYLTPSTNPSPPSPGNSLTVPSLSSSLSRRIQRSRSTSLENGSELYRKVLKPLDQVW